MIFRFILVLIRSIFKGDFKNIGLWAWKVFSYFGPKSISSYDLSNHCLMMCFHLCISMCVCINIVSNVLNLNFEGNAPSPRVYLHKKDNHGENMVK